MVGFDRQRGVVTRLKFAVFRSNFGNRASLGYN